MVVLTFVTTKPRPAVDSVSVGVLAEADVYVPVVAGDEVYRAPGGNNHVFVHTLRLSQATGDMGGVLQVVVNVSRVPHGNTCIAMNERRVAISLVKGM